VKDVKTGDGIEQRQKMMRLFTAEFPENTEKNMLEDVSIVDM